MKWRMENGEWTRLKECHCERSEAISKTRLLRGFAPRNDNASYLFSILHSPKHGMTLIELVIALAIVAILLPFIVSALVNPLVQAVWGDQMVKAMALAQERMEEIYATKANNSASLGYSYLTSANYPTENPVSGFSGFTRSVSFQDVAGSDLSTAQSGSGYRKVTVTVSWDSGASSVVLTGLVADY